MFIVNKRSNIQSFRHESLCNQADPSNHNELAQNTIHKPEHF